MELTLAVVGLLGTLAGFAYKIWSHRQETRKLEVEVERYRKAAGSATAENVKLRAIVAAKESQLAKLVSALAARMSASDLALALNELFRGGGPATRKPPVDPKGPAGGP